jgi:hypothetical protein
VRLSTNVPQQSTIPDPMFKRGTGVGFAGMDRQCQDKSGSERLKDRGHAMCPGGRYDVACVMSTT